MAGAYFALPGTSGSYLSAPDSAALDITGDIDIRVAIAATDWTPSSQPFVVGKWNTANQAYSLRLNTDGTLALDWSSTGSTTNASASTVAPTIADGAILSVRATLDVDNGASGRTITYYTKASTAASADADCKDDTGWTLLGSAVVQAGVTSIFSGSALLEFGSANGGSAAMFNGKIYAAIIKSGINGTTVFDLNLDNATNASTPWTEGSSNGATVTPHGSVTFDPGPATQTITGLGGIASSAAFGTPTVTPGPVTITGLGGIASSVAFGTFGVEASGVLAGLGGIASSAAFGTPVVTTGPVTITGLGGIASSVSFGTPRLSIGVAGLGGVASSAAFGTPTVRMPVYFAATLEMSFDAAAALDVGDRFASWTADEAGRMKMTFGLLARLTVSPPAYAPPDEFSQEPGDPAPGAPSGTDPGPQTPPAPAVWLKRVSQVWNAPTLNQGRVVQPWVAASETRADWGVFRLVIDGVDVTFYRNIPTKIESYAFTEPFDDAVAKLFFPQVTSHEAHPAWLEDWADVEIHFVRPDSTYGVLWTGLIDSFQAGLREDEDGLSVSCIGSLYQLDLYRKQPPLAAFDDLVDIGRLIPAEFRGVKTRTQLKTHRMRTVETGITARPDGAWEPVLTGWVAKMLSLATTPDGTNQWTVMQDQKWRPKLRLKDRTTVHWTVRTGQPGVELDLMRDLLTAPNTFYAQGVDPEGCAWRNAKYPNLHPDAAPVFDGNLLTVGETAATMRLFEQRMRDTGWTGFSVNGHYDTAEETFVRRFQKEAGLAVDGVIGPQTWAAAFAVGENGSSLDGAYFAPLAWDARTERFARTPDGGIAGDNSAYDPDVLRVETQTSYGARVTKEEATVSEQARLARDYPAPWVGHITLTADPREGSRYEVKAGQNIKVLGFKGADRLLHISEAEHNPDEGSVTLTVDEKARDLLTLAAMLVRDRENADPARRRRGAPKRSELVEDQKVTFDCENGAGIVPRHATYAGLWNVLRIPFGQYGEVVRSVFRLDTPARFTVGVFDRAVSHVTLARLGSPTDDGYWYHEDLQPTFDDDLNETPPAVPGLIVSWGGSDEMLGYSPGYEFEGDPLTGLFEESASWTFEATAPPWLWVAMWVESPDVNYIQGRFYSSPGE